MRLTTKDCADSDKNRRELRTRCYRPSRLGCRSFFMSERKSAFVQLVTRSDERTVIG